MGKGAPRSRARTAVTLTPDEIHAQVIAAYTAAFGPRPHADPQPTPQQLRADLERLLAALSDPALLSLLGPSPVRNLSSMPPAARLRISQVAASQPLVAAHETTRRLRQAIDHLESVIEHAEGLRHRYLDILSHQANLRDDRIASDPVARERFRAGLADAVSLAELAAGSPQLPESLPLLSLTFGVAGGIIVRPHLTYERVDQRLSEPEIEPQTIGELVGLLRNGYRVGLPYYARTARRGMVRCTYYTQAGPHRFVEMGRILTPRRLLAERILEFVQLEQEASKQSAKFPDLRVVGP